MKDVQTYFNERQQRKTIKSHPHTRSSAKVQFARHQSSTPCARNLERSIAHAKKPYQQLTKQQHISWLALEYSCACHSKILAFEERFSVCSVTTLRTERCRSIQNQHVLSGTLSQSKYQNQHGVRFFVRSIRGMILLSRRPRTHFDRNPRS